MIVKFNRAVARAAGDRTGQTISRITARPVQAVTGLDSDQATDLVHLAMVAMPFMPPQARLATGAGLLVLFGAGRR